ncbi:hypothetical protein FQV26_08445 [Planococcus sp. CPCC 101016]|uniref:hypothetical protein n=1 Tax=Planococcus sp. CPCC 101016 TaxID=2599617 RepID=UPI0011B56D0C|nr:hypothetical protein FQV26_08445 [Planococcus sp. CPCC 101016]
MNILKNYVNQFLIYPTVFIAVSFIFDYFRGNWKWFNTALVIILVYYFIVSFLFYFDLKKIKNLEKHM